MVRMDTVLNISAYRFVTLHDAPALRETVHQQASALGLKGTVLLAEEGINLFLAGPADVYKRQPVVMVDTRNAFEVDEGTFTGAIDWRIGKFSDFPQALRAHKASLQDKTVVSFCTGGIRCEKAAILMREEGLEHVYQLDGGILTYFEETDGKHYSGACFVFDERRAVGPDLAVAPLR